GNDANSGAFGQPVATLNMAISRAASAGKHAIYLSAGTYAAPTTDWPAGLSLYGGYAVTWARNANTNNRAVVTTPSWGWLLQNITTSTTIERVVIKSAPVTLPGESSQALRIVNSSALLAFRFVDMIAVGAGVGVAGAAGSVGSTGGDGSNASN